jgi:hypothetical protein
MTRRFIKGIPYEPDDDMPSEERQEDAWVDVDNLDDLRAKGVWFVLDNLPAENTEIKLETPPKTLFSSKEHTRRSNKDKDSSNNNEDTEEMKETK